MYLPDPGWLRPLLAFGLAVLGVILRFALPSRIGGFGLRRFRTHPDEDIEVRVRHRLGEMLLWWTGWTVLQMVVGLPESWVTTVWAPLVIVVAVIPAYTARLYAQRYLALREGRPGPPETPLPGWGGWPVILLREAIPLSMILVSILVVKQNHADIPDSVPVWWSLGEGTYAWRPKAEALEMLRHRTMFVYILLFGLEGLYLLVVSAVGRRGDVASRMLTPRHWLYFLFKVGWVVLFAGLNLGFVYFAMRGGSPLLFALPGLFALAVLGILVGLRARPPLAGSGPDLGG
jgi:hypothetical protein